jgi:hypothetical protein
VGISTAAAAARASSVPNLLPVIRIPSASSCVSIPSTP